jgi:anaerobic magnesium-protoporphyrin IX monomethyl ester cyclase
MNLAGDYRVITSRGCPYSCSYCFNSFFHSLRGKKDLRRRSVDNVIDELLCAKKQFSPKYISFWDDSFTTSKKWTREFCDIYRKKINLPFMCVVNPFFLDKEKTQLLRSAGCVYVSLGVQSTKEELCATVLNRKSNNDKISRGIKYLKKEDILVQIDHMLGIPGDTPENQENDILFYNNCQPNVISVYWLTYYPKTTIVKTVHKQGILSDNDIERIEEGELVKDGSLLTGGSLKDSRPYYSAYMLLNYLPVLPKWFVNLLVKSHTYRFFRIKNYYITTVVPRVIISLTQKRYYHGRQYILSFFREVFFNRFRKFKKGTATRINAGYPEENI